MKQSPLIEAIQADDEDAVRRALAAGAGVNELYANGLSKHPPLGLAFRNPKIVSILLERGADPNLPNSPNQSTAIQSCASRGIAESAALLIAAGANVNHMDLMGFTALGEAAMAGTDEAIEVMKLLLDAGADVEAGKGSTPLMMGSKSVKAMKLLLDRGANPNATRPTCGTALHVCIEDKNIPGIKLLLSRGADPAIPGPGTEKKPGLTALELARKKKVKQAIALLDPSLPPPPVPAVEELSAQFLKLFDRLLAKKAYSWQKPASEEAIAAFAKTAGGPLPPLLSDLYRRANGQKLAAKKPLFPAEEFLGQDWFFAPIEEAAADRQLLNDLVAKGEFANRRGLKADDAVNKVWWDPRWLPVLADRNGDHICIDFNPTASGAAGQVICFQHDSGERRLLAENFAAYVSSLLGA